MKKECRLNDNMKLNYSIHNITHYFIYSQQICDMRCFVVVKYADPTACYVWDRLPSKLLLVYLFIYQSDKYSVFYLSIAVCICMITYFYIRRPGVTLTLQCDIGGRYLLRHNTIKICCYIYFWYCCRLVRAGRVFSAVTIASVLASTASRDNRCSTRTKNKYYHEGFR